MNQGVKSVILTVYVCHLPRPHFSATFSVELFVELGSRNI